MLLIYRFEERTVHPADRDSHCTERNHEFAVSQDADNASFEAFENSCADANALISPKLRIVILEYLNCVRLQIYQPPEAFHLMVGDNCWLLRHTVDHGVAESIYLGDNLPDTAIGMNEDQIADSSFLDDG